MKNTERINKRIIDDVRENLGLEKGDTSKDDKINSMSSNEIFSRWCEWNGFINYSKTFRAVIGNIYDVDVDYNTMKLKTMKLKQDQEEALVTVEEILRMVTSTDNTFEENMHEYICEKLDISSDYLEEILNIVSKINKKNDNSLMNFPLKKDRVLYTLCNGDITFSEASEKLGVSKEKIEEMLDDYSWVPQSERLAELVEMEKKTIKHIQKRI